MYKEASKIQLRVSTPKGLLSVEQLWGLSLSDLSDSIKAVKKQLKKESNDDELSFLDESVETDPTTQLRYDILKDVYLTKKKELDLQKVARENKENDQKILALIRDKKENSLKDKSIEELEAMLSK